jgi:circadian clock protein KaiC
MSSSTDINSGQPSVRVLEKAPSGIPGFDDITLGGLPRGRTSLICGAAGCGKTLFAMQFLVNGIQKYDEPGVFVTFEETETDLAENFASMGFDLPALIDSGKLAMDHVRVERSEIEENGEYNLDGLFVRLNLAIQTVGARRVVLDTLEALFGGLDNYGVLRSELRRLFQWLKDQGVSAVVTAERGEGTLTRQGLEEYVSDCVVVLDHRVTEQVSTRRLRIVKYRGSSHDTNEFPFLIDDSGITVMPITSFSLNHKVSNQRVSSGLPGLDDMLGGGGYFKGSTVLISGTAGAGKSSLAAHFADSVCRQGERCLIFAFEESPNQIKRNMRSIGLDLGTYEDAGLLRFVAARPTSYGLETHLATMYKQVHDFQPDAVVVDPITTLVAAGDADDARLAAVRLVDFLKSHQITGVMTTLTTAAAAEAQTTIAISSIVDSWLLVRSMESNGERNRGLYVLKSRGMNHSNQVREFLITESGIDLLEVYIGPEGVLTGSARTQQESRERDQQARRQQQLEQQRRELARSKRAIEREIETLHRDLAAREAEFATNEAELKALEQRRHEARQRMIDRRSGDSNTVEDEPN